MVLLMVVDVLVEELVLFVMLMLMVVLMLMGVSDVHVDGINCLCRRRSW